MDNLERVYAERVYMELDQIQSLQIGVFRIFRFLQFGGFEIFCRCSMRLICVHIVDR